MNIVDSSAWLCFFAGDNNSEIFAKPIAVIDELLIPSVTLTEVFKCILRQRDEGSALEAVAHMQQGRVIPLDSRLSKTMLLFTVCR